MTLIPKENEGEATPLLTVEGVVEGYKELFGIQVGRDYSGSYSDNWLYNKLSDLIASVREEAKDLERARIKEIIEAHGHQQEDDSIWCDMDKVIAAIEKTNDTRN